MKPPRLERLYFLERPEEAAQSRSVAANRGMGGVALSIHANQEFLELSVSQVFLELSVTQT